jgi:hypothetical protein
VHLMGRIGLTIHFIAVLGALIKYHRARYTSKEPDLIAFIWAMEC